MDWVHCELWPRKHGTQALCSVWGLRRRHAVQLWPPRAQSVQLSQQITFNSVEKYPWPLIIVLCLKIWLTVIIAAICLVWKIACEAVAWWFCRYSCCWHDCMREKLLLFISSEIKSGGIMTWSLLDAVLHGRYCECTVCSSDKSCGHPRYVWKSNFGTQLRIINYHGNLISYRLSLLYGIRRFTQEEVFSLHMEKYLKRFLSFVLRVCAWFSIPIWSYLILHYGF